MPDPFEDSTCWERPTLFCPPIPMNLRDDIISGDGVFTDFSGDPIIFWWGGIGTDGFVVEPECCTAMNF